MGEKPPERARPSAAGDDAELDRALEHVKAALRGLSFGAVTVNIQDGVVVQVERIERTRLRRARS
ncbi:hypothetical protein AYO44_10695 [Planctomycetaceae bacterium SCGC AG-212-F19]|nr:hypothetical protein AYO44_10695 [Planctomycetaceae bacterium SCGC AG-212-F19]